MLFRSEPSTANRPVGRRHLVAAILVSLCLVAILAATMPYARTPTRNTEMVLPAYAAATFLLEVITSALLFALYNVRRSAPLLFLASGYLFSALLVPAWVLTFPGVFSAWGIEPGLQTTAAIAAVRRLSFPLFVLGFALAPAQRGLRLGGRAMVAPTILGVLALAAGILLAILSHTEILPTFMRDGRHVDTLWRYVPMLALLLYGAGIAVLFARRRSQLDIWVCLVLFSLMIEILLISYLGGAIRLSVGWWAGRLYGLAAASIILLVLLSETTAVYARLSRTVAAERRARQNRLIAMEALSASIAHEINQPLASMVTNADAALRWLVRPEPRLDRAEAALRRIVDDGHRANKVVSGIRTMFMKGTQERCALDLNALAEDAVRAASTEAREEGIAIETDLAGDLPPVIGNAVQLHQVLSNLIENGIDAVKSTAERGRRLVVRTRWEANGEVQATVEDNGPGIDPEVAGRIFDPFVSTKPSGMGMGLMFCRTVIEAHGGRQWASANFPRGAVFHFALPAAILPGSDVELEP